MPKPIVFMYSGQGSQYYHMARELYEHHPLFRKWMNDLDDIVFGIIGTSLAEIIYDPSKKKFDDFIPVLDTSLAIVMVEYALTRLLIESGIKPDYLLGVSLGEVTASLVADVRSIGDSLQELHNRLSLFENHCDKGKMIGILASPDIYSEIPILSEYSEIAAENFDSHFVVSCNQKYVKQIEASLKAEGIQYQTLPVSHGFHSSMLDIAKTEYLNIGKHADYKLPKIPIISCTYAKLVDSLENKYFWDIFRRPIQFRKTIRKLEEDNDYLYLDLGPSGTLANFVKYSLKKESQSAVFPMLNPFGQDLENLEKVQGYFNNHYEKD